MITEGQSYASPPITAGVIGGPCSSSTTRSPPVLQFLDFSHLVVIISHLDVIIIAGGFHCDDYRRVINWIDMDPLSVAASVAGVAATGVQLSQTIYDLIYTFYEAEKEMSSIANDISLLAMVLKELEGVLQRDSRVYQRRMLRVVNDILRKCESVFQSISNYVSVNPQNTRSSKQFQKKVCWYFQRHRVRPLQAGLESMKSTLNVLLHVVHLASVTEAAESFV